MTTDDDLVAAIRDLALVAYSVEASPGQREEAMSGIESVRARLADAAPRSGRRGRERATFSGSQNPIAPPMRISTGELSDGRAALIGVVRLDWLREGPSGAVHGGVLAGLFDELLGGAQRLNGGAAGVTGRLIVRYRHPTPLGEDLELRAWIHDERRRRVAIRGECLVRGNDVVTAEAEAVFLRREPGPGLR